MPGLSELAENAAKLETLEDRAVTLTAGRLRAGLETVGKDLLREWAMLGPSPTEEVLAALRRRMVERLNRVPLGPLTTTLASLIDEAMSMGIATALSEVDRPKETVKKLKPEPILGGAAGKAAKTASDHMKEARRLMRVAKTFSDFTRAMAQANQARTSLERTTRWAVNQAANQGAATVAAKLGAARLWVAERDGCVRCLAYSGKVAEKGKDFPGGLTFGDKEVSTEDLPHPPLHPNCRCHITPWLGQRDSGTDVDLPAALEREARRSILRGDALDSEPESVRVAAAKRLLAAGSGLPKSVETKARKAVKAGSFS